MMWPTNIPLPSTFCLAFFVLFLAGKAMLTDANIVKPAEASDLAQGTSGTISETAQITPVNLADYAATLERPLMEPDRRPLIATQVVAVVDAAPEPIVDFGPDHTTISLLGTIDTNGRTAAYLLGMTGSKWVKVGEEFDGWLLLEITHGIAVLQWEDQIIEKIMYE